MEVKYLFEDALYSSFSLENAFHQMIPVSLNLFSFLVGLLCLFLKYVFPVIHFAFDIKRLSLMVAAIRSIDALIDPRTGDDKTAFLVIFPDPVVWKQRKSEKMLCK